MKKSLIVFCALIWLAGVGSCRDLRAVRLEKFLAYYCPTSPLRGKTEEIVRYADRYSLDYRLYIGIAGAESTWGKKYPKRSYNLTGISNGGARFRSISHNIAFTHATIGTKKWYREYRKTRDIKDLVYVYKGVPPYDRYIRSLRFTFDMINAVPIAEERKAREVAIAEMKKQPTYLLAWNSIRYDQFDPRKTSSVHYKLD
jgi:hypothetical protein